MTGSPPHRQSHKPQYGTSELLLTDRPMPDSAIHLSATIIGEADSILSRMRSTGYAGASEARVLDRVDPLATLAAVR
jgi:hypothetical protein